MEFRNKLAFWRRRPEFDAGLAEELTFHIEERADELERSGLGRAEALRKARVEFGSAARISEGVRAEWQWGWLEDLFSDLRHAARAMRREPGFVAVAVLSLALGIGVNTAIFSLTMEMLASQPSARDASEIVSVRLGGNSHMDYPHFRFVRDAFPGVAGMREEGDVNWRNGDETQKLFTIRVTNNLFGMAGIPLAAGRGINPGDGDVVVVADRMWRGKLASDPNIVGRTLILDGRPHTVIGLLPEDHDSLFGFGLSPDVYTPVQSEKTIVGLYMRLPEGIDVGAMRERLRTFAARMDQALPETYFKYADNTKVSRVTGLNRLTESKGVSMFFGMLMFVVSLLLGIACLNVSGLLLARASSRSQEFAIRASLGAGRGRLLRQLLTESLLLALTGTAVGVLFHTILARYLSQIPLPLPVPIVLRMHADWRLLAYAACIAIACTLVAGILPAWRVSQSRESDAMKQQEHQVGGRLTLRRALVVAQVTASIIVLVTAALFARNLMESISLNPGFDLERTLFVSVRLVPERYGDALKRKAYVDRLQTAITAIPGVRSAATTQMIPLNDDSSTNEEVRTETSDSPKRIQRHTGRVGPQYFHTIGVPLVAGREFLPDETGVAIINEALAKLAFDGQPAVGRMFRAGDRELPVVGVVRDSNYAYYSENHRPAQFEPFVARVGGSRTETIHFMVRAEVDPDSLVRPLQRAAIDADPASAITVKPMRQATGMAMLPSRLGAGLLGMMGLLGLSMTGIGLYGLLSYSVARRVREIGLRIALGAEPGRILRLVFAEGARLVGLGFCIGIFASYFLMRPLAQYLVPNLSPHDPLAYLSVAAVLILTSWAACAVPARRALRIEPMEALRNE